MIAPVLLLLLHSIHNTARLVAYRERPLHACTSPECNCTTTLEHVSGGLAERVPDLTPRSVCVLLLILEHRESYVAALCGTAAADRLLLHVQDACDVEHLIAAHSLYLSEAVKLCSAAAALGGEAAAITGGRLEALLRLCHLLALLRCAAASPCPHRALPATIQFLTSDT